MKSNIPTVNAATRIHAPIEQAKVDVGFLRKRGRPLGSKNAGPRKWRGTIEDFANLGSSSTNALTNYNLALFEHNCFLKPTTPEREFVVSNNRNTENPISYLNEV